MKLLAATLLVCRCCVCTLYGGTSTNGTPATVWETPTTNWPDCLWVYKAVPQDFAAPVVSNLMAIGAFTAADQKRPDRLWLKDDKRAVYFEKSNGTQYLIICPTLGMVEYDDRNADAKATSPVKDVPEPVVGVPDETGSTQLGLKYLRLLGIDISQIARKPGGCDLDLHWEKETRSWIDQKTKKEISEIQDYGVEFTRSIDGIPVHSFGGMVVNFGNNAKVSRLRLSWRNLVPYALQNCPSHEQVISWIKSGQVVLRLRGSYRAYPVSEVQRLTITTAYLHYYGKYYDEPMDLVYPYAEYTGTAENEHTTNTVWFESPMTFSKDNWRVLSVK